MSRSWSRKAEPDHHTATTLLNSWYVLFWNPVRRFYTPSENAASASIIHRTFSIKSWLIKMFFFFLANARRCISVIFGQELFWFRNASMTPSVVLSPVESWMLTKWGLPFLFDVVLGSFYWPHCWYALGVMLVGWTRLGKVVSCFLNLWFSGNFRP